MLKSESIINDSKYKTRHMFENKIKVEGAGYIN